MNPIQQYDYIIVGGGTAGCLLANRLSANPAHRVLLIEAGGRDNWIWIHVPVGYLYCIANPRTDWMYRTTKDAGLNGRDIHYARGLGLGGCSLINGMIYMRGQARDYDEWAALSGDDSWQWQNVLPLFKHHEDSYRGASQFHGVGGEWRIEQQRLSWKILDRFREAAREAGIPFTDDFNRGDNEGSGKFDVTQRAGVRWHSGKAFLRDIEKQRDNLTIIPHSQATRLLFEGKRCTGVEIFSQQSRSSQRGLWQASARREVILCSGAIGSPQLLQLSGIGPAELLQQHNIPIVHALSGVGANLQDHLQLRTIYKVKNIPTLNTRANNLFGKALMGLEYLFKRSGPLAMAPSQLGIFARSSPQFDSANLEYHVQPLSLEKFGDPLHRFPAFTASVANLRPTSRGTVRIVDNNWRTAPEIHCAYLSILEDRNVAADSLRLTRRIASMAPLRPFAPEEYLPGSGYQSDAELAHAAGQIGTTIFHPAGTCKMGRADDDSAVVDAQLRVRGVESLRVVDASIMPTITSGNTNAPTLMIAEKAAAMILHPR
ncbi:MAG: choline dehydrogenase [Verrucomicrobiaceae bacterium]|nr:choline dehydrogenase [Verrucomicrobiaceae bacterium]